MATGDPIAPGTIILDIFPNTLTDLTVKVYDSSTLKQTYTLSDFSISSFNNSLECNLNVAKMSDINLTIESEGYQTQAFTSSGGTRKVVTLIQEQNLYAWSWTPGEYDGAQITTCYTTTPTPTTSDYIYYANGVSIPNNTTFYSGIGGSFYTTSNTPITSATSNSITLTGDGSSNASGGTGR